MQIRRLQCNAKHALVVSYAFKGKLNSETNRYLFDCVINLFANMQIANIVLGRKRIRMQSICQAWASLLLLFVYDEEFFATNIKEIADRDWKALLLGKALRGSKYGKTFCGNATSTHQQEEVGFAFNVCPHKMALQMRNVKFKLPNEAKSASNECQSFSP